jgi:hypothetical protein
VPARTIGYDEFPENEHNTIIEISGRNDKILCCLGGAKLSLKVIPPFENE